MAALRLKDGKWQEHHFMSNQDVQPSCPRSFNWPPQLWTMAKKLGSRGVRKESLKGISGGLKSGATLRLVDSVGCLYERAYSPWHRMILFHLCITIFSSRFSKKCLQTYFTLVNYDLACAEQKAESLNSNQLPAKWVSTIPPASIEALQLI